MLATADQLGPAIFGILKQFQWRKVAIIEQNENVFSLVSCTLWCEHTFLNIIHMEYVFTEGRGYLKVSMVTLVNW